MEKRVMDNLKINEFKQNLILEEKSKVTVEKYVRDINKFFKFIGTNEVSKERAIEYKDELKKRGYAVRSINSMISALNAFFVFFGWNDCCIKSIRVQKQIYCAEDKELKKAEYIKLLHASEDNPRLHMILQTICSTEIRVSELKHFTIESIKKGKVVVSCKNKTRIILVPGKLKKMLLDYSKKRGIKEGVVFRTRNGNPVNRSNIWKEMKKLCKEAGVNPSKVFPHNLRKLFARTFYRIEKDISKLADILGHSNINTTRIYIMTTEFEHRKKIERLGLVI